MTSLLSEDAAAAQALELQEQSIAQQYHAAAAVAAKKHPNQGNGPLSQYIQQLQPNGNCSSE
jgi:hypothetical protein